MSTTANINLAKMEPFEPTIENWSIYAARFKLFFRAYGITGEEQKAAMLLSSVGSATFRLLVSLFAPADPADKTFDQLVTTLTQHFEPQPLIIMERFKFNTRVQSDKESISDFVSELRRLAIHCNYSGMLDELLRDRFVAGLQDESTRKRLLTEPASKGLEHFVSIAQTMHLAAKENRQLSSHQGTTISNSSGTDEVHYVRRKGKKPVESKPFSCYRCGRTNHAAPDCKFLEATCHKCGKIGHIAPVCKGNLRGKPSTKPGRPTSKGGSSRSHKVEDSTDDLEDVCQIRYLNSLSTNKSERNVIMLHLTIDGIPIQMELDTGSGVSVISKANYQQLFRHIPLQPACLKLRSYLGEPIPVIGQLTVQVQYETELYDSLRLFVVPKGPTLFGRQWLRRIPLNWGMLAKANNFCVQKISVSPAQLPCNTTKAEISALLDEFCVLFEPGLGKFGGQPAHIYLKPGVRPRFFNSRLVPFSMQKGVAEALRKDEADGIIVPVDHSDWASPIVPVLKSDKSVRVCADFKVTINAHLEVQKHPLPRFEELFARLNGGQKYSKLDLSRAYNQVPIDESSQQFCVINTPLGLRKYCRLPFGISSAPGIFQQRMDQMLGGLPGVAWYLDDIVITGNNDQDHLQNLRAVFQRLKDNGAKLNTNKGKILQPEVTFLGHILNSKGITAQPDKLQGVINMPRPSNAGELKSFLGKIQYNRKFIPNQAFLSAKLTPLTGKVKWCWSDECESAFQELKKQLISIQLLVHYHPELPVTLACDASQIGLGAVLSHVMPSGDERPIAFASATLSDTEQQYSQIEKEAYAIIFGVKKFYPYLFGKKFTLITDHKPLTAIFGPKKNIPLLAVSRLQRWAILLSSFQYDIAYRNTKLHSNADALSRLPDPSIYHTDPDAEEVHFIMSTHLNNLPVDSQKICAALEQDKILERVSQYTKHGWPRKCSSEGDLYPYFCRRNEIWIENGVLFWKHQVIIPSEFQKQLLTELHEGHQGMTRMKYLARLHMWWPNLNSDIEKMVRSCTACQENHGAPSQFSKHNCWPQTERPFERVHIDYAGPFVGHYWLVLVDSYSKWPEVHQVSAASSEKTIVVLRSVFSRFGLPREIVSDNGRHFTSEEFSRFCAENGICHTRTPPYHPSSNGQAERFIQTFKRSMKSSNSNNLSLSLSQFLLRYRSTPHSQTGVPPAEIFLGRNLRTRLDLIRPEPAIKMPVSKSSKFNGYAKGSTVWVTNYSRSSTAKWVKGTILQPIGAVIYQVAVGKEIWKRHIDQIRKAEPDLSSVPQVSQRPEQDEKGKQTQNRFLAMPSYAAVVAGSAANPNSPTPSLPSFRAGSSRSTTPVESGQLDGSPSPENLNLPISDDHVIGPSSPLSSDSQRRYPSRLRKPSSTYQGTIPWQSWTWRKS